LTFSPFPESDGLYHINYVFLGFRTEMGNSNAEFVLSEIQRGGGNEEGFDYSFIGYWE